jgi:DNA-binding HxlR family transcriptional regulator
VEQSGDKVAGPVKARFISAVVYLMDTELKVMYVELRRLEIELSDELREEMRKLKEEMSSLKEQLRTMTEKERERSRGIHIDVGDRVHDYIGDVMEGVAEGIHGELDKCIFIGPRGVRISRSEEGCRRESEEDVSLPKAAVAMSALGQEHRLTILKELMNGGKYVNELQEKLSEITTSTLSSHLKVLEDAGLVVQEKVRGRYLITMPGRAAYEMARRVARSLERRDEE